MSNNITVNSKKSKDENKSLESQELDIDNKEIINAATLDETKNEFKYLLDCDTEQSLIEELKNIAPSLSTGYKIGDIDLKFPSGAISIIAAPTSHGKTSALINFSIGALEQNKDISAYFFSYEESASSIQISFLNTWIGEEITKGNNKNSIINYFKDNCTKFIKSDKISNFIQKKDSFFKELINPRRLKTIYSDMTVDKLIESIKFVKRNTNVGLICIDYMQLLKLYNSRLSRQEELKQICLMLKDCAIEIGIPIVIAAQFNRTVITEADLSPVNIGEAGDIERIASLIIGMYNRNFELSKDGNRNKKGERIEKESTIYIEILKGRNIGNGHFSIIDFDGNIGLLKNENKMPDTIASQYPSMAKQYNSTKVVF